MRHRWASAHSFSGTYPLVVFYEKYNTVEANMNAIPLVAHPLPLSSVRLTGGPLHRAQQVDAQYLLSLDINRMLAHFRERVGLKPLAEGLPGWDGGGRNLTGHIAGHYLSAVSLMYAATGDARFKERADRLVAGLKEVQDADAQGALIALEGAREKFAEVSAGHIDTAGFDLNGLWAPWYTLHKLYAGLRDAYRLCGNKSALAVEIRFAEWAEKIVAPLDHAQLQEMLSCEFGGMNEVMVDLYADTGEARWLELSRRFEHDAVLEPLKHEYDKLGGLHGNTQIPKLLGSLARYKQTGDEADGRAARFFWSAVTSDHTFATGGHGKDEYFGPPRELSARIEGRTAESCNIYNMLKMTRSLFTLHPDVRYAEFEERTLFNHVLGSINPDDGRTCYMVPVGRGVHREYQDMEHDFTCCVGSGMENHALHGAGIYFQSPQKLWVNQFIPSVANWKEQDVQLLMASDFPLGESATIRLSMDTPKTFTLALRRPYWAGEGFSVSVNGHPLKQLSSVGTYVEVARKWKNGDEIKLNLPKTFYAQSLPDDTSRVALMWGPLVLAADLGDEDTQATTPVLVSAAVPSQWIESAVPQALGISTDNGREVPKWVTPTNAVPRFRTRGVGRSLSPLDTPQDVQLVPFGFLHRRLYAAYFDLLAPAQWQERAAKLAEKARQQLALEAATISFFQPGEMQPERDFSFQSEDSQPVRLQTRPGRRSNKWMSFEMPTKAHTSLELVLSFSTEEWRTRTFDVSVNGHHLATQSVERKLPGEFFDVSYPIPVELSQQSPLSIRLQSHEGSELAALYGARLVKSNNEPTKQ